MGDETAGRRCVRRLVWFWGLAVFLDSCLTVVGRGTGQLADCAAVAAIFSAPLVVVSSLILIWVAVRGWVYKPKIVLRFFKSTHSPGEATWLRWYHAEVFCDNGAVARFPEVAIWPPDGDHYEQWSWPGRKLPELLRKNSLFIPIVLGNLTDASGNLANGVEVPRRTWFLTPAGPSHLGRSFRFAAHTRHRFKVLVSWLGEGHGAKEVIFELHFKEPNEEPEFREVMG